RDRVRDADHTGEHSGGVAPGLRAHRAGQRSCSPRRGHPARAAECAHPDHHRGRDPLCPAHVGHGHDRDDLFPPGARSLLLDLGRDVLTRVLYGGRYTLSLALAVVVLTGVFGMTVGVAAGYFGGWVDEVLMRVTEVVMAFPAIILAMAIVVALGPGLFNAGLA